MTWRPDAPASDSYLPTGARQIRENFRVIQNVFGADVLNAGTKYEIFPVGTRIWFYQDTAPDGWSIVTSAADCLLSCKSDGGTYTTGGTMQGSWQQSDHALTNDEMPRHSHQIPNFGECGSNPGNPVSFYNRTHLQGDRYTNESGSNQPHNHGNSWRPLSAVGIIAEKT